MYAWVFLIYFGIFVLIFWLNRSKEEGKRINYKKMFIIPAILAFFVFLLSVVKIFIIYKILLIIIALIVFILTYWQWGDRIRKFFR